MLNRIWKLFSSPFDGKTWIYLMCTSWNLSEFSFFSNGEPAELNLDVALRALSPNSLFSKVVFSYFLSQNIPLVLVYHHASNKLSISHRMKNQQDAGYRQCFVLDKSCRKMYTIFSVLLYQQRKSVVMASFGHTGRSAVYYKAGSPLIRC
jgi:hypothetical protein